MNNAPSLPRLRTVKHIWLAAVLPMAVMALIYLAMEVWPFGKGSVLVLDLNGQYVYYFEALRDILRGEQGFLYSFERALGGEFLGIIAYYLASPFSFIVALFPEGMITESLYWILLLKCGLSGFNMCYYLHASHPTRPLNEVLFAMMYALSSYAIVQQHNTMWIDCLLFFPLILLGVERLIKYGKTTLYTLTLAAAVFSNYYIGYMVCIGVAAYFFFYYFVCTPEERNPLGERKHFPSTFIRMVCFSLLGVGMAASIILPAYHSLSFGKNTFSKPNFDFVQRFDFLDMLTKMYPSSYDTVRPEGLPFLYCGTLVLILLPVFFIASSVSLRKRIGYGAMMLFFIFSFNGSTIDLIWHGFQRPNWLNYRYSFMLCFIMVVAAYLIFEHIDQLNFKLLAGSGVGAILLLFIMQKFEYENLPDIFCVWFTILLVAAHLILLGGWRRRWLDGAISTVMVVFLMLELFCNGLSEVVSLDEDVSYSSRTSYVNFMNKWEPIIDEVTSADNSFYRAEKTEHRKTNDNFTLNIKGLSNSTSTLNARQIDFLQRLGYSSKSHWSKYLGGTPVSDSLLGVKYLFTLQEKEMNAVYGDPISTDETNETAAYRNDYALSLGYMISEAASEFDMEDYDSPFELMNDLVTDMLGSEEDIELFKAYKKLKPETENLEISYATGHRKYTKIKETYAGRVIFTFTPVNDREIFVYFPSEFKRDATLKVNGEEISEYFTNETCRIVSIGRQPAGEELIVSLNLDKTDLYVGTGVDYFWYLDEELFRETMTKLQEGNYRIDSHSDSAFDGSITVHEDRTLFLMTVPFDEDWKILCDGEPVETFEVLDCLTAAVLTPGEHTLSLRYQPRYFYAGVAISAASILIFIAATLLIRLWYKKKSAGAADISEESPAGERPAEETVNPPEPEESAPSDISATSQESAES